MCYIGHHRFLLGDHKYRHSKQAFNGEAELRHPPKLLSRAQLQDQMMGPNITFGKRPDTKQKNKGKGNEMAPWKKESIVFHLLYWKHLLVHHYLDVMHVEKNVSKNILATLLGIKGKTKDTLQSCLDLKELNIRHSFHPIENDCKTYIPPACFTLSKKEKDEFISILASVKVPDGYASNISRLIMVGKNLWLKKS